MKSTGNDIVALNAIDIQRTISLAFYSKFVTVSEQALYRQKQFESIPFENFIWLLWSVKESVYKYLKRYQPDLIFPPAKIIIQKIDVPRVLSREPAAEIWESDNSGDEFYTGKVAFQSHHLFFRSKVTSEFIASIIADSADFNGVYWGVKSIKAASHEAQSREVRAFALTRLKALLNNDGLMIEKNVAACPVLKAGNELLNIPISLAHHHNFVAYSFFLAY